MMAKKWVRQNEFEGMPKPSDFKLVEETLSDILQDREVLLEAEWYSIDPYMRIIGVLSDSSMPGSQIARVIKSRHPDYPEGTKVVGSFGWRDRTVYNPDLADQSEWFPHKVPDLKGLPESLALGALGMPGNTAYFGVEKVLKIKEGGTLVVSAAAGAVGSIVCQLGKLKGCKVLAFTGSFEKTIWLKQIGVGYIFDYNIVDVDAALQEYAPDGVDYYFDNVGGEFAYTVQKHMKQHGKIAVCGAVSTYNKMDIQRASMPFDYLTFQRNHVVMEGLTVWEYASEWLDAITKLRDLMLMGKINAEETISKGFESMPEAFINLLKGENIGKQLVKA